MHTHRHVCACPDCHLEVTGQFVGVTLCLQHVGPRDGTKVTRIGGNHLYLLNHLCGPTILIFLSTVLPLRFLLIYCTHSHKHAFCMCAYINKNV